MKQHGKTSRCSADPPVHVTGKAGEGNQQTVKMKFTEHLSAHITPEWRKQYIQYEAFKEMLYAAQDQAPSIEVTDEDTVKRYYAKFEEKFFQTCEKELAKINTFYSEKLAEAQRRFATLQNELQSSLDAQRESWANGRGLRRRKTVFALSQQERCKHRNIKDLQLAFSEFYLSLILLQNYQVHIHTRRLKTFEETELDFRLIFICCPWQDV